jgi:predicted GNAT family acetyltransferase
MKVPRHSPLAILVQERVRLRRGKVVGSVEGKGLGRRLYYEQMKEIEQGPYFVWSEFLF